MGSLTWPPSHPCPVRAWSAITPQGSPQKAHRAHPHRAEQPEQPETATRGPNSAHLSPLTQSRPITERLHLTSTNVQLVRRHPSRATPTPSRAMPFRGRPSKGCGTCRRRKIKVRVMSVLSTNTPDSRAMLDQMEPSRRAVHSIHASRKWLPR